MNSNEMILKFQYRLNKDTDHQFNSHCSKIIIRIVLGLKTIFDFKFFRIVRIIQMYNRVCYQTLLYGVNHRIMFHIQNCFFFVFLDQINKKKRTILNLLHNGQDQGNKKRTFCKKSNHSLNFLNHLKTTKLLALSSIKKNELKDFSFFCYFT